MQWRYCTFKTREERKYKLGETKIKKYRRGGGKKEEDGGTGGHTRIKEFRNSLLNYPEAMHRHVYCVSFTAENNTIFFQCWSEPQKQIFPPRVQFQAACFQLSLRWGGEDETRKQRKTSRWEEEKPRLMEDEKESREKRKSRKTGDEQECLL